MLVTHDFVTWQSLFGEKVQYYKDFWEMDWSYVIDK